MTWSRLERRTPLTGKTRLERRTPLRVPVVNGRRWSTLRARSPKKEAARTDEHEIRQRVFRRDGGCLLRAGGPYDHLKTDAVPSCFGPLTPHHRRKSGRGGAYSMANICCLCAHHNDELESDADYASWARTVGLVVRQSDPEWEELGA